MQTKTQSSHQLKSDLACCCRERRKGKHTEEFKQLVERILQQHKFSTLRSAKLSLDDFLRLLACFNESGIHFAS